MLRDKIIATVVIVGVVCLVFFTIIYPPRQKEFSSLVSEYKRLEKRLNVAIESLKDFKRLQREYDSLITTRARIEIFLPEEKDVPNLLEDIARVGTQCGVEIMRFKPQTPVSQGFCTEIPISFNVRSGYHQLGRFLSDIGNFPRLLKVKKLHVSSHKKEGLEDVTLQASFVVSAYTITK